MSAPRGEERPSVSCLLYRLPPFLSPPLTLAAALRSFLSLPRSFSISVSLHCLLSPTHSISPPPVLYSQPFLLTNTPTLGIARAHKHTQTAPSRTFLFKARSKKLKFYLNECLLFLLPRCVCVGRRRENSNKHASVCVCVLHAQQKERG